MYMKSTWKNGNLVATSLLGAAIVLAVGGSLMAQKSEDSDSGTAAKQTIDDHSKAGDQLKSIAAKDNIDIPSELDAKHKAMVAKYSSMSGAAFDRGYMAAADFQKEAGSGANYDLKNWAGSTLPTLHEHLRIARDTERSLGATSSK
jgi:putative membrane protein